MITNAYDAEYGVAYASAGDGTLAVITTPRADMPAITQTIALGVTPGALAVDERSHRVLALSGSSVVVVSGNTRRVEATLPLPGPAWGVAANAATGRAFVAGDGAGPRDSAYVRIYDLDSLREVTTIGVSHATSLALDQEQNFLYLAEPSTAAHYGRITVVDARLADASTFVSFAVDGMTAIAVDSTHSSPRATSPSACGSARPHACSPPTRGPADYLRASHPVRSSCSRTAFPGSASDRRGRGFGSGRWCSARGRGARQDASRQARPRWRSAGRVSRRARAVGTRPRRERRMPRRGRP